jgi:Trk K+ transport system NAD-binding subunit
VLELLNAAGTRVVVIDTRCLSDDPRLGPATLIQGDCQKQPILEQAGVVKARGVVILPSDELVSITTALMVRRLNPTARVVVRMFNQNLIARLGSAVTNMVALSTSALAAPLLALIARTGEALGTVALDHGELLQITELTVQADSPLCGTSVGGLSNPLLVLAHTSESKTTLLYQVDASASIQPGDRLVLCGAPEPMARYVAKEGMETSSELLWAGLSRRLGRVIWKTLGEVDMSVKVATAVLLTVIFGSALVFNLAFDNETIPDALYRTISLMATGSDMHGSELPHGGWQKVFVSGVRLVGLALTAAFTAILTNYLVRAHLGGVLEARRIPEGGHIVVCGLGNVGFRVVEELLKQGENVVVIERQRDNAFVATARRQGVPVIVGDATVREVLRQAHAGTARAVVAATSKELLNLEIALLVRELNPKQRVVLLMVDPQLAQTIRQAAEIRLAVSVPALAGPAFVAALLGDRVRNVFPVAGKLLAVVDLRVQAGDSSLTGMSVKALAMDYNLLPVRLSRCDGTVQAQPLEAYLAVGDRLSVIVGLSDLQRMLRREGTSKPTT